MNKNALLFGSSGALGSTIYKYLQSDGFNIFTAGIGNGIDKNNHISISYTDLTVSNDFCNLPSLNAVVWSHGLNISDSILDLKLENLNQLLHSNVVFIAATLSNLLKSKKLVDGSKLVIVSSIWQLESRADKLSYTISKSALQGLVKSCAIDLGSLGILINAVLPGVVDTPMTREHLTKDQIAKITNQTALHRLASPEDIASAVAYLVSSSNRSMTGQFLTIDGGFLGMKNF